MLERKSSFYANGIAEVNGIEMFYIRAGEGYQLLLLHGGTRSHLLWDQHIPILSEKYEVFVPDLRGHGKSSKIKNMIEELKNKLEDFIWISKSQ